MSQMSLSVFNDYINSLENNLQWLKHMKHEAKCPSKTPSPYLLKCYNFNFYY